MSNVKAQEDEFFISRDLIVGYACTWIFAAADIILKGFIIAGYPLLFDNNLSIAALCLRGRVNLQFGLELQNMLRKKSTSKRPPQVAQAPMSESGPWHGYERKVTSSLGVIQESKGSVSKESRLLSSQPTESHIVSVEELTPTRIM